MKTCSRCHESKPVEEFSREAARSHLDGRHNYCKSCVAAYLREYRQQEPERFRRYEQERLERHGEERREHDRERWATRAAQEGATRARFARKMRAMCDLTNPASTEAKLLPHGKQAGYDAKFKRLWGVEDLGDDEFNDWVECELSAQTSAELFSQFEVGDETAYANPANGLD